MAGGTGPAPEWRMEQGGPRGTHIPPATPHLMTTRLPFTSTLSRVSLLERDMFAAGRNYSNPAQPVRFAASAFCRSAARAATTQRVSPRPFRQRLVRAVIYAFLLVKIPVRQRTLRLSGAGPAAPAPVTSLTQPPLPEDVGSARGSVSGHRINGPAPYLRENHQ